MNKTNDINFTFDATSSHPYCLDIAGHELCIQREVEVIDVGHLDPHNPCGVGYSWVITIDGSDPKLSGEYLVTRNVTRKVTRKTSKELEQIYNGGSDIAVNVAAGDVVGGEIRDLILDDGDEVAIYLFS